MKITARPEYHALGKIPPERMENYRALFEQYVEREDFLQEIGSNTNKGMAVGNDRFKEEIKNLTGRRVTSSKRGRSAGWRKKPDV